MKSVGDAPREIPFLFQEILKYLSAKEIVNLSTLNKKYHRTFKNHINHFKNIHTIVRHYPFLTSVTNKYIPITQDQGIYLQTLENILLLCDPLNPELSADFKIKIIEKEFGITIDTLVKEGLEQNKLWNNMQLTTIHPIVLFYLLELYGARVQETRTKNSVETFIKGFVYLVYLTERFNPKMKLILKICLVAWIEDTTNKITKDENFSFLNKFFRNYKKHIAYECESKILQQFFEELGYAEYARDAATFFKGIFAFDYQINYFHFSAEINKIIQFVTNLELYLKTFGYNNLLSLQQIRLCTLFKNTSFSDYIVEKKVPLDVFRLTNPALDLLCSSVGGKIIKKLDKAVGESKLIDELKVRGSSSRNIIENLNQLSETQSISLIQNDHLVEGLDYSAPNKKFFAKDSLLQKYQKYLENFNDFALSQDDFEQLSIFENAHPQFALYFNRCPKILLLAFNYKAELLKLLHSIQHPDNKRYGKIVLQVLNEMATGKTNLLIKHFFQIQNLVTLHNTGILAKLNHTNSRLLTTEILKYTTNTNKLIKLTNNPKYIFQELLSCQNPDTLIKHFEFGFLVKNKKILSELVKFVNWHPEFAGYILKQCNDKQLLALKKMSLFDNLMHCDYKFIDYLDRIKINIEAILREQAFFTFLFQHQFMRELAIKVGLNITKQIWNADVFKNFVFNLKEDKTFYLTDFLTEVVLACFQDGEFKLKNLDKAKNDFLRKKIMSISTHGECNFSRINEEIKQNQGCCSPISGSFTT